MNILHPDFVMTVMKDLLDRRARNEITGADFENEAAPLLSSFMDAVEKKYSFELSTIRQDITELRHITDSYRQDTRNFTEFLESKGLNEEFVDWLFERMEQEEAGEGNRE